jgi:LmbE family N-acetylglucosaminyl deacetylase
MPRFWDLPDGGLAASDDQSERVAALLRAEEPSLVLALGADGAYGHPDHLAVYRWVTGGVSLLGAKAPPLLLASFPRGLFLPQYELCVSMLGDPPQPPRSAIGANDPDLRLPIAPVRAQKLASIAAHRTQLWRGDPQRLFPGGIVKRLLEEERYTIAAGPRTGAISALLADIAGPSSPEMAASSRFEAGLTKRLHNLARRVTDQGKP